MTREGNARHFLRLISAALMVPVMTHAAGLNGVVLDPQGLVVQGAKVTLSCRGYEKAVKTDARGHFSFQPNLKASDCEISATHRGFAPFHQALGVPEDELSIRLTIEALREVVNIAGERQDESPLRQTTLGGVSLVDTQLRAISNSTEELIRYAKLLSGASFGSDVVYVDGMPAASLPPAAAIARITVNADPFSAEYADGDQNRIEIFTKQPDREFRFSIGGGSLGAGGGSVLAPNLRSRSNSENFALSGPVPALPLTFSLHVSLGNSESEVPVRAILPPQFPGAETAPQSAVAANRSASGTIDISCRCAETVQANFSYSESRGSGSNMGVGELSLPETGFSSSFDARSARVSLTKLSEKFLYRQGFSMQQMDSITRANSSGYGLTVIGNFTAGGGMMLATGLSRSTWNWKTTIEPKAARLPWTIGLSISAVDHHKTGAPNPAGNFTFDSIQAYTDGLGGAATASWLGVRGDGNVGFFGLTAAPFIQKELFHSAHAVLRAGLRADYQSGFRTWVSPRLSGAKDWRGFVFRAGAGLFVRNVPSDVILTAREMDGTHLQQFWAPNVQLDAVGFFQATRFSGIRARLSPNLTRPREFLAKSSVERSFGQFTPGVEYTWTRARHLLGSRRLPDGSGWLDLMESNRSADRNRLQTRVGYRLKTHTVTAYYEWIHSRDDGDGPLSYPAQQDNLRSEWARSTGVSPHNVSLVGSFQLPVAVSLTVMESWRGSAPYNITTGMDLAANGLYNDRGGRARNSGNGPGYQSLSVSGYRRIPLPSFLTGSRKKMYMNLGVHADNLLGNKNYLSLGSVAGAATFGQPLAAFPGRSVRFWFNID